jgi:hypothetical protein
MTTAALALALALASQTAQAGTSPEEFTPTCDVIETNFEQDYCEMKSSAGIRRRVINGLFRDGVDGDIHPLLAIEAGPGLVMLVELDAKTGTYWSLPSQTFAVSDVGAIQLAIWDLDADGIADLVIADDEAKGEGRLSVWYDAVFASPSKADEVVFGVVSFDIATDKVGTTLLGYDRDGKLAVTID